MVNTFIVNIFMVNTFMVNTFTVNTFIVNTSMVNTFMVNTLGCAVHQITTVHMLVIIVMLLSLFTCTLVFLFLDIVKVSLFPVFTCGILWVRFCDFYSEVLTFLSTFP